MVLRLDEVVLQIPQRTHALDLCALKGLVRDVPAVSCLHRMGFPRAMVCPGSIGCLITKRSRLLLLRMLPLSRRVGHLRILGLIILLLPDRRQSRCCLHEILLLLLHWMVHILERLQVGTLRQVRAVIQI